MIDFDFLEPPTVGEASRMLADLGDEVRVIAGGTALILALRQRMVQAKNLVSVARIERLNGIRVDDQGGLHIGAMTRHADVGASPLVQKHQPMLAHVASVLANPQVRNQGTIGGNLCYADPATDPSGCLLALGASVILGSLRGERVLPMHEFLVDYYTTALAPDELLVEIVIPAAAPGTVTHYSRYLRTAAEHRPLVNFSIVAQCKHVGAGKSVEGVTLVLGASTIVPTRCSAAEQWMVGKQMSSGLTADALEEFAAKICSDIQPISDSRGSAEYRRKMAGVLAKRSLLSAFETA